MSCDLVMATDESKVETVSHVFFFPHLCWPAEATELRATVNKTTANRTTNTSQIVTLTRWTRCMRMPNFDSCLTVSTNIYIFFIIRVHAWKTYRDFITWRFHIFVSEPLFMFLSLGPNHFPMAFFKILSSEPGLIVLLLSKMWAVSIYVLSTVGHLKDFKSSYESMSSLTVITAMYMIIYTYVCIINHWWWSLPNDLNSVRLGFKTQIIFLHYWANWVCLKKQ